MAFVSFFGGLYRDLQSRYDTRKGLHVAQECFVMHRRIYYTHQLSPTFFSCRGRCAISKDLNHVFFSFPFTVPSYFALITRALIVLEGIALTGDPAFDIFHASYPYARSRAVDVFGWQNTIKILGAASKSVSS